MTVPDRSSPSIVLFLCSGNYYRSRFADLLFNARAGERGLPWIADSRGLAPECFSRNEGPIARSTVDALAARHVHFTRPHRSPLDVTEADLARATRIIALKEAEHRAMLRERFPAYENRVEYWHVHDVDAATPADALPEIERLVHELLASLERG